MNASILRRGLFVAGLLAAGLFAAPAAFARTHVSIGLGFYGPGYSIGINDCVNCYGYRPYYAPGYSYYPRTAYYYPPPYYPAYPRRYYAPVYYAPAYYAPAPRYYPAYPVYGTVYSNEYPGRGGSYYHQ
ncbi:MAG: hypothetical protein JSS42_05800 [Proteobacteria bacterium]|nr:hypothetical protein [Pseudomonadota bacterium]MBS0582600.1 hypothetical protein [Pseudomonadota bacterium]